MISRFSASLPSSSALLSCSSQTRSTPYVRSGPSARLPPSPVCTCVSRQMQPDDKGLAEEYQSDWLVVGPTGHLSQFILVEGS